MFYLQVKEVNLIYKGNFNNLNKDYAIFSSDNGNPDYFLSNTLEYKEKINAFILNMVSSK
jgi:hypothetical protein